MIWVQKQLSLQSKPRACLSITSLIQNVVSDIPSLSIGQVHVFLKHTSASLTINENADPRVQKDLESSISRIVPEHWPYTHNDEGKDDMPAHLKTALVGYEVTIPITNQKLALGTWQGIYLWEHRDHPHTRHVVVTVSGIAQ